jgi:nucleoid-associated protein YgaU
MSLQYLTIEAYTDGNFRTQTGTYKAMLNPAKISESLNIDYTSTQAQGKSAPDKKYSKTPAPTMTLELVFDGTGVVDPSRTNLTQELQDFRKLVYKYNGKTHRPNFLKIKWGNGFNYQCRLSSLSIEYTLFSPGGAPLRAKASLNLTAFRSTMQIQAEDNKSSPDMTHELEVKAGDTLPDMCRQVYGDEGYFVQVARHNKLYNYRRLQPGTTIQFPPLTRT